MTNLAAASIKATSTPTTRPLGDRFGEVVNVRDFGAVGTGLVDDRGAIQDAFNYAFGTKTSPHGGLNDQGSAMYTNKAVFFPAGHYTVSSPHP